MGLQTENERLNLISISGRPIVQLEPDGLIDMADIRNLAGWPIWFTDYFADIPCTCRVCPGGALIVGASYTLLLDTDLDISTSDEYRIYYQRPDGVTGYLDAQRQGEKLYVILSSSLNNQAGAWRFVASAILSGNTERSYGNTTVVNVSLAFTPKLPFIPFGGVATTVGLVSKITDVVYNTVPDDKSLSWQYVVYVAMPYQIRYSTGVDLSNATQTLLKITKPDNTVNVYQASKNSDGILSAAVPGQDNDQAGLHFIYPYITFGADIYPASSKVMKLNISNLLP